jgi:hypothetical protein
VPFRRSSRHGYFGFSYSLKVPFTLSLTTATLVLEQTSGEGCFDERPRNSNEPGAFCFARNCLLSCSLHINVPVENGTAPRSPATANIFYIVK